MENFNLILSAFCGSGIATTLAKLFLTRSLTKLDSIAEHVLQLQQQIGVLTLRFEDLNKERHLIFEHERKIAALEGKLHARPAPVPCPAN